MNQNGPFIKYIEVRFKATKQSNKSFKEYLDLDSMDPGSKEGRDIDQ